MLGRSMRDRVFSLAFTCFRGCRVDADGMRTGLVRRPDTCRNRGNRRPQHSAPSRHLGFSQIAIHVGGGAVGSFVSDEYGQGGTVSAFTDSITVPPTDPAPAALYQAQRYGQMTYTIPGLTAGSAYVVRLHFAELWFGLGGRPGSGQRMFNVAVNGAQVLNNFDVFATAGAADTAVVRDFNATASAGGQIVIALTNGSANNPLLNGIEIIAGASGTAATAINVGGPAVGTSSPTLTVPVGQSRSFRSRSMQAQRTPRRWRCISRSDTVP